MSDHATSDPSTVFLRRKIVALNRVAAELRGMLADAPRDDAEVAGLLADCDVLEQVAAEMESSKSAARFSTPASQLTTAKQER